MDFKQKLYSMLIGLLISSSVAPAGIAPVSSSLSRYPASYGAKAMPAWSNSGVGSQGIPNPQATLNPKVLAFVAQPEAFTEPLTQPRIKPHPTMSGRGMGAFRGTGANLMRATSPVLMSRSEATNLSADKDLYDGIQSGSVDEVIQAIKDGANVNSLKIENRRSGETEVVVPLKEVLKTLKKEEEYSKVFKNMSTQPILNIIELLLDNGANPSAININNIMTTGNDQLFDLFMNKNAQFDVYTPGYIKKDTRTVTPHMVDTYLSTKPRLDTGYLSGLLDNLQTEMDKFNIDQYYLVPLFMKHGYQFNLTDLERTFSSNVSDFKVLKTLLSSDLLSKDDYGRELNPVEVYGHLVKRLEKLKTDIDQPIEWSNKPRKYTVEDVNEVLNIAHDRLNQATNEASFMNRASKAFKGGMSSMWRSSR